MISLQTPTPHPRHTHTHTHTQTHAHTHAHTHTHTHRRTHTRTHTHTTPCFFQPLSNPVSFTLAVFSDPYYYIVLSVFLAFSSPGFDSHSLQRCFIYCTLCSLHYTLTVLQSFCLLFVHCLSLFSPFFLPLCLSVCLSIFPSFFLSWIISFFDYFVVLWSVCLSLTTAHLLHRETPVITITMHAVLSVGCPRFDP